MQDLDMVLDKIEDVCNPDSVFLYGSRARNDALETSDYEIGVLMRRDRYVSRSSIQREINNSNFNIYPFVLEDFLDGRIDTPFQKTIYLYELIGIGKTLRGQRIIEQMKLPEITLLDLMQSIRFDLGFALASVISQRNEDIKTASVEFYKSCLFGLRCLEIFELKKIVFTYPEIYSLSGEINLDEYTPLISHAYDVRNKSILCETSSLFKNISFLNEFVESRLIKDFRKNGNTKLI